MRVQFVLSIVLFTACGGNAGDPDGGHDQQLACGRPGRSGKVDCNPSCSAGQYCRQESNGFESCQLGCTSDENCTADEVCERSQGQFVGTCVSCSTVHYTSVLPNCVSADRTGDTDCNPNCQPGQYCGQDSNGFERCHLGCTSDANCGPTEHCDRSGGAAVGTCASCYSAQDSDLVTRCKAAADRAVACGVFPSSQLAAMKAACDTNAMAEAPVIDCVEQAGSNCSQVNGCFASMPTPTCAEACSIAGQNCYEWLPTDVSKCMAFCADASKPASAKQGVIDCVVAASEQSWFACGDCKPMP